MIKSNQNFDLYMLIFISAASCCLFCNRGIKNRNWFVQVEMLRSIFLSFFFAVVIFKVPDHLNNIYIRFSSPIKIQWFFLYINVSNVMRKIYLNLKLLVFFWHVIFFSSCFRLSDVNKLIFMNMEFVYQNIYKYSTIKISR